MNVQPNAILSRFVLHALPQCDDGLPVSDRIGRHGEASACFTYGLVPRITCVDQAVIQAYLREHEEAAIGMPDVRVCRLPVDLERSLSKLPAALARVMVGRDLILIDMRTGRVVDRVRGVRPVHQLS